MLVVVTKQARGVYTSVTVAASYFAGNIQDVYYVRDLVFLF